ncbi:MULTISPECIES: hypothetical protein [unclassified Mesorhizobium]|uniref:hypothetical protein n=1 Tax=unclassified Mesorhizobium TaxID=325217 RepID=UPI00333A95F0
MQFDNDRAPFGRHFALSIWNDAPASWRDASGLVDRLSFEPSIIDLKPKSAGPSRTARAVSRFAAAIRARISGPGGYYNLGNALGLAMGVAMHSPPALNGVPAPCSTILPAAAAPWR